MCFANRCKSFVYLVFLLPRLSEARFSSEFAEASGSKRACLLPLMEFDFQRVVRLPENLLPLASAANGQITSHISEFAEAKRQNMNIGGVLRANHSSFSANRAISFGLEGNASEASEKGMALRESWRCFFVECREKGVNSFGNCFLFSTH